MRTKNKFCNYSLAVMGLLLLLTLSCKKDAPQSDILQTSDVDGNVYNTILIGNQIWMVENLNTTRYSNGDPIPTVTDNTQWTTQTNGAQCFYYNASPGITYGRLYNWYAANDPRNIAPPGWHVATDQDWVELETYVATHPDGSNSTAQVLAAGNDWVPSTVATAVGNNLSLNNVSGFEALPGGIRSGTDGSFSGYGSTGAWWTSTEDNTTNGWRRSMNYNLSTVDRSSVNKNFGFTVRCVHDY